MLLEIYLFFVVVAMVTFIISLCLKENDSLARKPALLFVSAIFFAVLAFTSTSIQYVTCQNQISYMNTTITNVTSLTNNIVCRTTNYYYQELAYLFAGLATLSLILVVITTLITLRKEV